jgi:cytidylate kinase
VPSSSDRPSPRPGLVVAVDGPSGSGKSSVSRAVAARLGLRYLDTGAMYRAVTWWVLERGVDVGDPEAVAAAAGEIALVVGTLPDAPTIAVGDIDVSGPIRGDLVTAHVSAVSAVPAVRRMLVARQRAEIGAGGIVVEGRDIGSAVAPDADVKVYLTADESVRAARRAAEHSAADTPADVERTRDSLARRDRLDSSRTASPLRRADGAVEIDATHLSLDEVVARVVELAQAVTGQPVPEGSP